VQESAEEITQEKKEQELFIEQDNSLHYFTEVEEEDETSNSNDTKKSKKSKIKVEQPQEDVWKNSYSSNIDLYSERAFIDKSAFLSLKFYICVT